MIRWLFCGGAWFGLVVSVNVSIDAQCKGAGGGRGQDHGKSRIGDIKPASRGLVYSEVLSVGVMLHAVKGVF